MSHEIPLVDFGSFLVEEGVIVGKDPTPAQQTVAQQLDVVCRSHGFLCLTNFGMSEALRDRIFAVSKELFDLPNKEERLARIRPQTNTGYAPFRSENINRARPPELKEAFNLRFPPKNTNDFKGCVPSLIDLKDEMLAFYQDLAHRYGMACALALKLPPRYFADTLYDFDLCTVRMLHYPPCNWEETARGGETSKPLRIGEHTDFGAYTFLMVHPDHGPDGLQIKPVIGGEIGKGDETEGWRDVLLPNAAGVVMIVNTGALMARWTNDEWKATAHRVVVPSPETASCHRYSVACFVDPDSQSVVEVHPQFYEDGRPKKYEPITSSDYLQAKLTSMMKKGP